MKKLFIIVTLLFSMTGCLKKDNMEDIQIYTTAYPIEYIIDKLYGEHSTILSIYPNGVNINKYDLTKKQIKDYSKGNMYIFTGLSSEKNYVSPMFQYNKNIMIIDASQSMEYNYKIEELWLDPSNLLMMTLNIKNGLTEYITNHYLKNEIEQNYKDLKVTISNMDAKLKLLGENATNKTIIADNNMFKFLEKYGFTVISLEETEDLTDKMILEATQLLKTNNQYIFTIDNNDLSETVQKVIEETEAKTLELHTISNLTDKERNEKEDYISLLNKNIEQLKQEIYD